MADVAALAQRLRTLHRPGDPLVLPNVWDAATAHVVAELGAPALATSSAAVAGARGWPDKDVMPPDVAFGAVADVVRAAPDGTPVTADLEAGYRLDAAELVDRLLGAGAVGCNLEDTDHHGDGVLVDADRQAERLHAVRDAAERAGVPIVLNARIDLFLRDRDRPPAELLPSAIERARRYLDAGADTVYPIGLADEGAIAALVDEAAGMVNIWLRPDGLPLARLRELGVARCSSAGALYRVSLAAVRDEAARLLDHT